MERIGHEATFKYGKMEYEMENAMTRCDRLEGDDDYEASLNVQRPNTKAKEGGSLYVENTELVILFIKLNIIIGTNKLLKKR